jgi:hypothetical protein
VRGSLGCAIGGAALLIVVLPLFFFLGMIVDPGFAILGMLVGIFLAAGTIISVLVWIVEIARGSGKAEN